MNRVNVALSLAASLLGGCIVVHDHPHQTYAPPPPPPASAAVVVEEDQETHYVVYREYFGCSDAEIYALPHYRHYYGCTDDDFYFCFFVSRRMGLSFDACFRTYYYDCGRSCDRLVAWYRVPRQHFFIAVGAGTSYPPGYAHAYSCYHSGSYTSVTFTNQEYVSLIHLRVGVEYQGCTTTSYFARVNECGGNTTRVIVKERDHCGRGGTTCTGVTVQKTAPRPWTMPPEQKHGWQQAHQQQVARSETSFKDGHKDQVEKVRQQERSEGHPTSKPDRPSSPEKQPPPGRSDAPNDSGNKHAAPDRPGKPPSDSHGQEGRKESPPPPSDSHSREKEAHKDAPPQKSPSPPPPKEKGGSDNKGKDKEKDKDRVPDRSAKDRRSRS